MTYALYEFELHEPEQVYFVLLNGEQNHLVMHHHSDKIAGCQRLLLLSAYPVSMAENVLTYDGFLEVLKEAE